MPSCVPRATHLRPPDKALRNQLVARGGIITSTVQGVHADGSYHYCGQAIDVAPNPLVWAYLYGRRTWFVELFGPTVLPGGGLYHAGQKFTDSPLQAQHQNHIHVAYAGDVYPPAGGTVNQGTAPPVNAGPKTKPCLPGGGCPPGYTDLAHSGGSLPPRGPVGPVQRAACLCTRNDLISIKLPNPLGGITDFFSHVGRYMEMGAGGLLMIVGLGVVIIGVAGVSNIPGATGTAAAAAGALKRTGAGQAVGTRREAGRERRRQQSAETRDVGRARVVAEGGGTERKRYKITSTTDAKKARQQGADEVAEQRARSIERKGESTIEGIG